MDFLRKNQFFLNDASPKVEVKVPDTPPVVSSLKKPAEVSAPSVQPHVEDDSAEDGDFSLSEAETEDSLEWASETERTRAEDDLAEDKVSTGLLHL